MAKQPQEERRLSHRCVLRGLRTLAATGKGSYRSALSLIYRSAREPLPQQGDYKDDNADHHSDRPRSIGLFRHGFHSVSIIWTSMPRCKLETRLADEGVRPTQSALGEQEWAVRHIGHRAIPLEPILLRDRP
jgi:hypothetical protein